MDLPTGEVCFYRPNRKYKRRYSAKDVARIYCHALDQGVSRDDIEKEISQKCGDQSVCDCEGARLLMPQILKALAVAVAVLAIARFAGQAIGVMVRAIPAAAAVWARYRLSRDAVREAGKQLEDASKNRPVIEGVFQKVDDWIVADAKELGKVVVKE